MNDYFIKLLDKLELTPLQKIDAQTKYRWVCKVVHKYFFESDYDGSTKYLFWSYKKKTNIRPILPEQDVDVLIKLPYSIFEQYDAYESNGQSALIQKIKTILSDSYTTTDHIKWWWKVILVKFSDWEHNVELLPAFEQDDGTFIIPNSENWGSWDSFDPRTELDKFLTSNDNTFWLTRKLSKLIKKWGREVGSLSLKSFQIEEYIVGFLENYNYSDKDYSIIIRDFFEYLLVNIDSSNSSYVQTALNRANKAQDYINDDEYESAVEEYKKIFGKEFPSTLSVYSVVQKSIQVYNERFIEDLHRVSINPAYQLNIDCSIEMDWFRKEKLSSLLRRWIKLQKKMNLTFEIESCNIPFPYEIKWKVRNFWMEAEINGDLRWEISSWKSTKKESTKYKWEHLVECYIVKDDVCIARKVIEVPIN